MPGEPDRRRLMGLLVRGRFGTSATIAAVALACLLVLGAVAARVALSDRSFRYYSLDPTVTLGGSPLVGLLSHIGVLLTWGAGVICVFAGALVARARGWRRAAPLLGVGAGAAYLALDDLFLLHESVFPDKLRIGQTYVYVTYVIVTFAFLWWYRQVFRKNEWPLLALALACLGGSVLLDVDVGTLYDDDSVNWLEDSLKFFGFAFLAAYLLRLSVRIVVAAYPLDSTTHVGPKPTPTSDPVTAIANGPSASDA